jgi:hypothetical protein
MTVCTIIQWIGQLLQESRSKNIENVEIAGLVPGYFYGRHLFTQKDKYNIIGDYKHGTKEY